MSNLPGALPTDLPATLPGNHGGVDAPVPKTVFGPWPEHFAGVEPTKLERNTFGEDTAVCAETGFCFETGIGAASREQQTASFKQQLCDAEWCRSYLLNDPMANKRHPGLMRHYKQSNPQWWD